MQQNFFDLCVIGAGPAGLSAACMLASANANVALIYKSNSAKSVNAGETLHNNAFDSISKLQLVSEFTKLDFKSISGFESTWGTPLPHFRPAITVPGGSGWLLNRGPFEAMLRCQVQKKGGKIIAGDLTGAVRKDGKWHLTIHSDEKCFTVCTSFLVIATGRKAVSYMSIGQKKIVDKLICYTLQMPFDDNDMTVRLDSLEQGWLYTVKNNAGHRVISYFTDGDLFKEKDPSKIAYFISKLIDQAPSVSKVINTLVSDSMRIVTVSSANTTFLKKAYGHGWVACGDCVQTYDPLSSQGISSALMFGIEAANAAIAALSGLGDSLEAYELTRKINFLGYLKQRKSYYNMEKRWPHEIFWSRRK